MPRIIPHIIFALALAGAAAAEPPKVATDIAPVHSLVSQVMRGVAEPALIIPQDATPHAYAMRPSEARGLSNADLVVWVGPVLTPSLPATIAALASDAHLLSLMDVAGTTILPLREGGLFGAHDHAGETGHDDHEDHEAEAEHEDAEAGDPHVWLDPRNAALWLGHIAEALAAVDPENAAVYRQNARDGQQSLHMLEEELAAALTGRQGVPFIVYHDGFHPFEARFGVEAVGAIAESDARMPGAERIAALLALMEAQDIGCITVEPQFNDKFVNLLSEGRDLRLAELDPLGISQELGPTLYPNMMRRIAGNLAACLTPS